MKRIIALAAAAGLAVALTACGEEKKQEQAPAQQENTMQKGNESKGGTMENTGGQNMQQEEHKQ